MSAKWVSVLLSAVGFVLVVLGLFLPWGEWSGIPGRYGGLPVLGIDTLLGVLSIIGWLITVLSWVLVMLRKPKPSSLLAIGGGTWIVICAFAWILDPDTLFGVPLSGGAVYRVSYGAYVSFAGGALTLAGGILALSIQSHRSWFLKP